AGIPIGMSGNSGNTTGAHLHFEVYQGVPTDAGTNSVKPWPISGYNGDIDCSTSYTSLPTADVNGDHIVNVFDRAILVNNWNSFTNPPCNHIADLNADCVVNSTDWGIMRSQWAQSSSELNTYRLAGLHPASERRDATQPNAPAG